MAKDIILKNQVWEDVPAVDLPIDGGGKQRFTDVSGTTATPSDVASGKLFFDSTGTQQTGASSGGGANLQSKTATYTPTTSQQTDTIRPDSGYDGLSLVNVIIEAMQGGIDMPTFTLSGIQEGSTVTCDKTYAECLALYNNGMKVAVAVTTSYGKLPVLVYETGTDYIKYIAYFQDGTPLGDITLNASSVSYAVPSVIEITPSKPVARKSTVTDNAMKVNVAVGYYKGFYPSGLVAGDPIYVSASEVVSGTKSISANGTDIDVTNYASVDVSVPSGAPNLVEDDFTTGSSAGHTEISIPYTGSGYPIMAVVVVDGGAYNSAISPWYSSVQRYAVGQWTMTKSVFTSAPTYSTSGTQNQGVTTVIYKNSTSSSTSYTRTSGMSTNVFSSNNASNSAVNTIKFKSGNVLSYYVNTSSYGLLPNTKYRYWVIYSE